MSRKKPQTLKPLKMPRIRLRNLMYVWITRTRQTVKIHQFLSTDISTFAEDFTTRFK